MQVCKPCHYTLVEAVEPFKLHPMSLAYLYEVFEHLLRIWMGTWLHTHTGKNYSVLLAVYSAICPASFDCILPFCMGQNILADEWITFMPFICK
jgi:hypothetical protein